MSETRSVVLIVLASFLPTTGLCQWRFIDLHPSSAIESTFRRVRDGYVVGNARDTNGYRAISYSVDGSGFLDLHPAGAQTSAAVATSNGVHAGNSVFSNAYRAGRWISGSWQSLHPGWADGSFVAHSAGNTSVGFLLNSGTFTAAVWDLAAYTSLHPAGAFTSEAYAVAGQQVGGVVDDRAVLWNLATGAVSDISPTWTYDLAVVLTTDGTKQGGYARSGPTSLEAVLWEGTAESAVVLTPEGSNEAYVYELLGNIQVGQAWFPSDPPSAFLWKGTKSSAENLNGFLSSDFTSARAHSIWQDASGTQYIAGSGFSTSGGFQNHAVLWISEEGDYFAPTSLTTEFGVVQSGVLGSLAACDDDWLIYRPGIVFSTNQFPVTTIVTSILKTQANRIAFLLDSSTTAGNSIQEVSLYNFQSKSYDVLDVRAVEQTDFLARIEVSGSSGQYINPTTNEVKARIRFKPVGPVFAYPWRYKIDRASWWVAED